MKQVTIHNLAESTQQEVFDYIAHHMLTQGKKAYNDYTDSCCYRIVINDGEVLKCAAGCLIPDEDYDPKIEGKKWRSLPLKFREFKSCTHHEEMISLLQSAHDFREMSDWKTRLREIGEHCKLSTEILDQFKDESI